METKHTETPWEAEKWSYEDGKRIETVIVGEKDKIATMDSLYRPMDDYKEAVKIADEEKQANAAFIVLAVNAHDVLVAALEAAVRYVEDVSEATIFGDNDHADYDLLDELKTALAKAKG